MPPWIRHWLPYFLNENRIGQNRYLLMQENKANKTNQMQQKQLTHCTIYGFIAI